MEMTAARNSENITADQIVEDLRVLARDAEGLVRSKGRHLSDRSRAVITPTLDRLKQSCRNMEKSARSGMKTTDGMIRAHPYRTMGVAVGAGMLLGLLLLRK